MAVDVAATADNRIQPMRWYVIEKAADNPVRRFGVLPDLSDPGFRHMGGKPENLILEFQFLTFKSGYLFSIGERTLDFGLELLIQGQMPVTQGIHPLYLRHSILQTLISTPSNLWHVLRLLGTGPRERIKRQITPTTI